MLQVGDFVKIKKPENILYYNSLSSQYKEIVESNQNTVFQIVENREILNSTIYYLFGLDNWWFFEQELEEADAQIVPDEEFISMMF